MKPDLSALDIHYLSEFLVPPCSNSLQIKGRQAALAQQVAEAEAKLKAATAMQVGKTLVLLSETALN